jgi:multiple sugar transport system substrate-binding protein
MPYSLVLERDLAWELITTMSKPEILAPWLSQNGFLSTQIPIGERFTLNAPESSSFPYYNEMISLIPFGGSRPSIPEYPQIADHIKQALEVFYGLKKPKQALGLSDAISCFLIFSPNSPPVT